MKNDLVWTIFKITKSFAICLLWHNSEHQDTYCYGGNCLYETVFTTLTNCWRLFRNSVRTNKKHETFSYGGDCSHICLLLLVLTFDYLFGTMSEQTITKLLTVLKHGYTKLFVVTFINIWQLFLNYVNATNHETKLLVIMKIVNTTLLFATFYKPSTTFSELCQNKESLNFCYFANCSRTTVLLQRL